jgi:hypothetical protein
MGKDLRTNAVHLKLARPPKIDGSVWGFKHIQPFFPPLEKLFKTDAVANIRDYGIRLSEGATSVRDKDTVKTDARTVAIHRKTTMLVCMYKWMRGDYGPLGIPKPAEIANDIQFRLQNPNNAGYVGALASILLSESGCPHFPKVFGVYTGIVDTHTVDISDDYEELSGRGWFGDNLGKTFDLQLRDVPNDVEFSHTRRHRACIGVGDEALLDGVEDIDADHVSNPETAESASEFNESSDSSFEHENETTTTGDDIFDIESCDCEDDESDSEYADDDDDEPFAWATFRDVPVVTTVMEKCDLTFVDMIRLHKEPEKHVAWVAQIVFAMAFAQRTFGLTHNDLHSNNVMCVPTTEEYLYYNHANTLYRVPTYGYLIKIIDFDRAIFSVRLQGMKEPKLFASSQFNVGEEAEGQYNMEPFYVREFPHILPNPSFDLVRFAISVFWDLFPQGPDGDYTHPLFKLFLQWTTLPDGSSVMFRKLRDNHDRYHGFHLYKAIARYCKDSAVPRKEIAKMTAYQVASVPLGKACVTIEN